MSVSKAIIGCWLLIITGVAMSSESELNSQIAEVADFFSGKIRGEVDVLYARNLARAKLDYSLDSLDAVSKWLLVLRQNGIRTESAGAADSIIWSGAYVGEVIKRCAKKPYSWVGYEEYMSTQKPSLRNMIPCSFGTQFLLASNSGAMTLPINKVIRFLEEGPENDLRFYAAAECKSGQ